MFKNYCGYKVNSDGQIYSKIKNKPLKSWDNGSGYEVVSINVNGKFKKKYVHRIVAETFLKNSKGLEVNHKDGDKKNNCLKNLEWVTHSQNEKHAYAKGLNTGQGKRTTITNGTIFITASSSRKISLLLGHYGTWLSSMKRRNENKLPNGFKIIVDNYSK